MKRRDLEHIIRAAGSIVQSDTIVIIGSQSILGAYPDPPAELTTSQEADVYPAADPEKADLIDGSIGEMSLFHEQFGYYAHGIGTATAVLPKHWMTRVITIVNENTRGVKGLCLHPADLAVSKLAAGRERDLAFVKACLKHKLVSAAAIEKHSKELSPDMKKAVIQRLSRTTAS